MSDVGTLSLYERAGRASSAAFAIISGALLGIAFAKIGYEAVTKQTWNLPGAAAWATAPAAIAALWKYFSEVADVFRQAIRYCSSRVAQFEHFKSLMAVAGISFGVSLGVLTLKFGGKSDEGAATAFAPNIEYVYVISSSKQESPRFIATPMLVYKMAKLIEPDMPLVSNIENIMPSSFKNGSVTLADDRKKDAVRMVEQLARDCSAGPQHPLELEIYGFANDEPIRNSHAISRQDSNLLNWAVANMRGKALADALNGSGAVQENKAMIKWSPWQNYDAMLAKREEVFRSVQIAFSPEIDHRSAVIELVAPGTCLKASPQGATDERRASR